MPERVAVAVSDKVKQHWNTLLPSLQPALNMLKSAHEVVTNWTELEDYLPVASQFHVKTYSADVVGLCGHLWDAKHVMFLIHPDDTWLQVVEAALRMNRTLAVFVAINSKEIKRVHKRDLRLV